MLTTAHARHQYICLHVLGGIGSENASEKPASPANPLHEGSGLQQLLMPETIPKMVKPRIQLDVLVFLQHASSIWIKTSRNIDPGRSTPVMPRLEASIVRRACLEAFHAKHFQPDTVAVNVLLQLHDRQQPAES